MIFFCFLFEIHFKIYSYLYSKLYFLLNRDAVTSVAKKKKFKLPVVNISCKTILFKDSVCNAVKKITESLFQKDNTDKYLVGLVHFYTREKFLLYVFAWLHHYIFGNLYLFHCLPVQCKVFQILFTSLWGVNQHCDLVSYTSLQKKESLQTCKVCRSMRLIFIT